MITLIFSSTISLNVLQEIGGYITLIIDIIASIILLYKVIATKNLTPKKVAKLVTTNKGKQKLAKIISEILNGLNAENNNENNNENKEDKK